MRQLVIQTHCDVCLKQLDVRTDADESLSIRLTMGRYAKRIDLCTEHKDPTWSVIQECWQDDIEADAPPTQKETLRARQTTVCPWCDKPVAVNNHGVLMHASRMHPEIPLAERQQRLGFPVTERNVGRNMRACPECGKAFDNLAALGGHVSVSHHLKGERRREALAAAKAVKP